LKLALFILALALATAGLARAQTTPINFPSGFASQPGAIWLENFASYIDISLTSVAAASGGSTVYTGTITNGASNALVGTTVVVTGFDQTANNGTFVVRASTATTMTLNNAGGVADTHAETAVSPSVHLVPSVTHNGSNAWFKTPESIQAFTNTFTFHINCAALASNCGDGIGWMIVCACSGGNAFYNPGNGMPGYTYSGFSSGQFSWSQCEQPLSPATSYCWDTNGNGGSGFTELPNNALIKFDTYNNFGTGAPGAGFTGLYLGGNYPQGPYQPQYDMTGAGISPSNGHEFTVVISYNGALLTETITDQSTSAAYTRSYIVDLPYQIAGNTAFIGYGGGTGAALQDAFIDSWVYTVPAATGAATPTFSVAAGPYASAQTVSLASTTPSSVICYSTTAVPSTNHLGTGCGPNSTLYTGPITVSSSESLMAVAGTASLADSSVIGTATYVIGSNAPLVTSSIPSGSYSFPIKPTFTATTFVQANSPSVFYCTTTVETGTCTPSTAYTNNTSSDDSTFTVSSPTRVGVNAQLSGLTTSPTTYYDFAASGSTVATPTFSPVAGSYTGPQSVAISTTTTGATIYYTTDGSTPTTSSAVYSTPITVSTSQTIKAIGVLSGDTNSSVGSAAYTISTGGSVMTGGVVLR
jgi:Chitobiase/beta-hexosaminidase C-terminal domain